MKKISIYLIAGLFVVLAITLCLFYLHKKSTVQTNSADTDTLHSIVATGTSVDRKTDFFIDDNPFVSGFSKSIFTTSSAASHQMAYWVIDDDKQKIYSLMESLPVALPGELENVEVVRSGSIVLRWSNNTYTYVNPQGEYKDTPFGSEQEAHEAAGKETPNKIHTSTKSELTAKFDDTKQLCGYVNEKDKWVLKPSFTVCEAFTNKVAKVNYFGFESLIDTDGNWLFEKPELLSSNLSPREQMNLKETPLQEMSYGVINTKGEWIRLPYQNSNQKAIFLHAGYFYDCNNDENNGSPIPPCKKQKLNSDETPQTVDSLPEMEISNDTTNVLQPKALNDQWGFVDKDDNWVIKPKYQEVSPFSEGLAAVKLNERWHYIDEKDTSLAGDYALAHEFHRGLAWVSSGAEWNLINKNEEQVGNKKFIPEFDDFIYPIAFAHDASGGNRYMIKTTGEMKQSNLRIDSFDKNSPLIPVCELETNKCGYLNDSGDWAIAPKFKKVSSFVDGYALVDLDSNILEAQSHYELFWVSSVVFSRSNAFTFIRIQVGNKTVGVLLDTKSGKFYTKSDFK